MAKRDDAFYDYGLTDVRLRALNDDKTQVEITNIIGGAGPFDFTGETITAVPMSVNIDGVVQEFDVSLSVASQAAVTVAEVVIGLNAIFVVVGDPVALTAATEALTGRIKLAATSTPTDIQVYGKCAQLILIGQGFGTGYIYSDTMLNLDTSAIRKDSEDKSVTNARGLDTTIKTEGYYKSENGTLVDTATDWALKAFLEGTPLADDGSLSSGVTASKRPSFTLEAYYGKYKKGDSDEGDYVGVRKELYFRCKGMSGDKSRSADIAPSNYTFNAQTYVDASGVEHVAWTYSELTIKEYNAIKF